MVGDAKAIVDQTEEEEQDYQDVEFETIDVRPED